MIAGQPRDAVVAAITGLAPPGITVSARGDSSWHVVYRPARFERMSASHYGSDPADRSPERLAQQLVADISGLLGEAGPPWPGLASNPVTSSVQLSDDGLQVVIRDDAGHRASSDVIPIWDAHQRQLRVQARADLEGLGQSGAPAHLQHVSLQLTRLLLTDHGHLRTDARAEAAVRVATFCDLALLGRFRQVDGAWELSGEPMEVPHVDLLLDALTTGPDRELDEWITEGPDLLRLTAEHLVAAGTWRRHQRRLPGSAPGYAATGDPDAVGVEAAQEVLARTPDGASPALVVLAGCAVIARALGGRTPDVEEVLLHAGSAIDVLSAGLDWSARRSSAEGSRPPGPLGDPGPQPGYWGP